MIAIIKENAKGEKYISISKDELKTVVDSLVSEKFNELKESFLIDIDKKVQEILLLIESNKKINTELRGLDQKGINENTIKIDNLLKTFSTGFEVKFE